MYRLIEADHYINKQILVVGGGDSAVEAAMGLAYQVGNTVTLSCRQPAFARIKERNAKRIEDSIKKGKINVLFNSNPVEFTESAVVLEVNGARQEIPNDFVWIFAGGRRPTISSRKSAWVSACRTWRRKRARKPSRLRMKRSSLPTHASRVLSVVKGPAFLYQAES